MVGTSNESTRVAWLEKALAAIPAGSRILDAGAGECQFARFCTHLEYVSQDFSQYNGRGDGSGLQMGDWCQDAVDIVSDIAAIPESEESFDAILCVEVLEHLPNPLAAIREFSRLLRPGGTLVLTAPFCSLTHFSPYHFASGFNRYYYERHLPSHGFRIVELAANGNYFEYIAQEVRRLASMASRYCDARPTRVERYALRFVLSMLERFSALDRGSDEVLCYGYHVVATRCG